MRMVGPVMDQEKKRPRWMCSSSRAVSLAIKTANGMPGQIGATAGIAMLVGRTGQPKASGTARFFRMPPGRVLHAPASSMKPSLVVLRSQ